MVATEFVGSHGEEGEVAGKNGSHYLQPELRDAKALAYINPCLPVEELESLSNSINVNPYFSPRYCGNGTSAILIPQKNFFRPIIRSSARSVSAYRYASKLCIVLNKAIDQAGKDL
jgi:hypothetical protein